MLMLSKSKGESKGRKGQRSGRSKPSRKSLIDFPLELDQSIAVRATVRVVVRVRVGNGRFVVVWK